jgi:hypothetical protein
MEFRRATHDVGYPLHPLMESVYKVVDTQSSVVDNFTLSADQTVEHICSMNQIDPLLLKGFVLFVSDLNHGARHFDEPIRLLRQQHPTHVLPIVVSIPYFTTNHYNHIRLVHELLEPFFEQMKQHPMCVVAEGSSAVTVLSLRTQWTGWTGRSIHGGRPAQLILLDFYTHTYGWMKFFQLVSRATLATIVPMMMQAATPSGDRAYANNLLAHALAEPNTSILLENGGFEHTPNVSTSHATRVVQTCQLFFEGVW